MRLVRGPTRSQIASMAANIRSKMLRVRPWSMRGLPAHSNMTTVPKPTALDLAGGFSCKYDAWNRLTNVTRGSNGRQIRI